MIRFEPVKRAITKVVYGSATPNNSGISRIINGTQSYMRDGRLVYKAGVKHLVAEFFYRDCLTKYMKALKKGNIEEAAQILKGVPKSLKDTFLEYGELNHLFAQGNGAKIGDKLSKFRQKVFGLFSSKQKVNDGSVVTYTVRNTAGNNISKPAVSVADKVSTSAQLEKIVEEKPMAKLVIDLYRQDHVSDDEILKILKARLYHQKTGDRFYRFVGSEELNKVLSGKKVTSNRPCHNGVVTDVTTDPNYGGVPTLGKYRILFKDKPAFNPYSNDTSRIASKEISKKEFHLLGGYSLDDVEKIEQKLADNGYKTIWTNS